MAVDFRLVSKQEFDELEKERKEYVSNLFIETVDYNEIISELRFIYGYLYIGYLLINGKDEVKLELNITKIDGQYKTRNIHLAFIGVGQSKQRKGIAHKHLQILTTLADRYEYEMDLEIDEKFGMNKEVLRNLYSSHGFIADKNNQDKMYRPIEGSVKIEN